MEYDIKLTQQELSLIYHALQEVPMPLKFSAGLFAKLQQEQARQDEEKAIPVEAVKAD